MSGKLVLITGGAGFIGGHLADALLEKGHHVRVLDSLVPAVHGQGVEFPEVLSPEVEWIKGDVRDEATVSRALEKVDIVFHLASLTGVGQSMYQVNEYTSANVSGTANLLQCLIDGHHRIQRLVLASSRAVYGEGKYRCADCGVVYPKQRSVEQMEAKKWDLGCPSCGGNISWQPTDETALLQPSSVYGLTKKAQEDLVFCVGAAYDLPVVALRYFNVYGPGQSPRNPYVGLLITFLSRLTVGKPIVLYEDGQMRRDFVHVRDVVAATVAATEHDGAVGRVINVGSGQAVTVEQIANELLRITESDRPSERISAGRVGDVRHAVADCRRAQDLIGYEPQVALDQGLQELADWFRKQQVSMDRSDQAFSELQQHNLMR